MYYTTIFTNDVTMKSTFFVPKNEILSKKKSLLFHKHFHSILTKKDF